MFLAEVPGTNARSGGCLRSSEVQAAAPRPAGCGAGLTRSDGRHHTMPERPFVAMLAAFVLAGAPVAARADSGWSVVLDSDSCCCAPAGGGRATFVVNDDMTQVSYRIEFSLTSPPTQAHIHAPVLPGESPMALTLTGDIQNRDCGAAGGFQLAGAACGTLTGTGVVDPTIVGYMMDGLAWVVVHTPASPFGEACGRIESDPTPSRTTSWGRVKLLYR